MLNRKSGGCIVPMILGNSNGGKAATLLLPFIGTHFLHTEVGNQMETKLSRIAELAKSNPNMKFTSLVHLLDEESLKRCHHELPGNKAMGINQVSKDEYGEHLEENISNLVSRLKTKGFRPSPVRRAYIDKPGSNEKRPLGIPEHEDKIVQRGIAKILNSIYENDFF